MKLRGNRYGGYRIIYDYHTHTTFSHGKGSIEDNVLAARAAGLRAIAIADHGPGHLTYGVSRENIPKMRAEIDRLKALYTDIEIFLSVEANIANTSANANFLDVAPSEFKDYDFVIAGYHYGIRGGFCVQNFINNILFDGVFGHALLRKNTDMAVKSIYENDIKILTHPGDKGPFDILELAKACEKRETLMEINSSHGYLTVDDIKIAAQTDVKFIISSDAHTPQRVGDGAAAIERVLRAGIDPGRVVNLERV